MAESNQAAFKVLLDGRDLGNDGEDLTGRIGPLLISLSISEKRGGEADQLDLKMKDVPGMPLPKKGATVRVMLGWKGGPEVRAGLVDKGTFKIDDVGFGGPPDMITLRGRSADLTSSYRVRKERSHNETTLGELARKVAGEHGLEARVAPELASVAVTVLAQDQESDMAMIRRIGRRHDAVATVKGGKLILSPIGRGATPSGRALPQLEISRGDGDPFNFQTQDRDQYDGVEARWHDKDKGKRQSVKVEGAGAGAGAPAKGHRGRKVKRLGKVYHSEGSAKRAAKAEHGRMKRAGASLDWDMSLGRPDISPELPVRVRGFRAEVDALAWRVAEVTHTLDAGGGLSSKLKLETA
jgi:phage protein D